MNISNLFGCPLYPRVQLFGVNLIENGLLTWRAATPVTTLSI